MRLPRQHVRLAARSFARHRGFSAIAVLSLGLAIALNTTMYSVIDGLVNPKLEIADPQRLYGLTIWGDFRHRVDDATRASLIRSGFKSYEAVSLFMMSNGSALDAALEHGRRYRRGAVATVAPNFFRVLGARPVAGRTFVDADLTAESQPVVVTEGVVRTLFATGDSPVGKVIDIDGSPAVVIGVVSNAAHLPDRTADVYRVPPPGTLFSSLPSNLVRLRADVPLAVAEQEMRILSARLAALLQASPKDVWFQLSPMKPAQFRMGNFHYALIGAVIAVLLVACANLANMQLARGIGRSRELALRSALGASRGDIVTQLVLESALLAGGGLVLGLVLTFCGVHLLESRIPPTVASYITAPQTSWRVFAFAVAASLVCVMLVGLVPAIRVSRVDPNDLLKSGAGTGAHRRSQRQYGLMVILEIGLSLVLLSGAAVVVRSAMRLNAVRLGINVEPLSIAWMSFRAERDTVVRYVDLANELTSRARALPDAADATVYFTRMVERQSVTVYGSNGAFRAVATPLYSYKIVTASYLRTHRLRLIAGRDFPAGVTSEPQVIVDKKTAAALWPGRDPVGEQIKLGDPRTNQPWIRVVGVAADLENPLDGLTARGRIGGSSPIGAIYYLPDARDSVVLNRKPYFGVGLNVVVRSRTDHERMPITLRHYFGGAGRIRLVTAGRMDEQLWVERASHDFIAATFSAFAALAISLAALGIYGLVSHAVAERRREIGVRIALGASARDVLRAVLREGNVLALSGVALGLLFTKYTAGWLRAFSMEDDQYDAPLFAAMAAALFIVAVVAALAPALRATRTDPVEALRSE